MTFSQIQQLLAIEKSGTLSAAAEQTNTSQPALTRAMQKLETELGVELFTRTKNRVELNEARRLAVEYARPIVSAAESFTARMEAYRRSQTTVSLGFSAPGPMWVMTSDLVVRLPDKTIASEMRESPHLEEGLLAGTYQLVVLDRPMAQENVLCREYATERLYLSLPPAHPLASKKGIWLSELAGQTMLLFSDLGVWQKLCEERMKEVHFIVQRDREAFADLITASALPNFTTNLTRRLAAPPMERIEIPILDEEAVISFYLCVLSKNRHLADRVPPCVL